jgi:hypothetical protein
MSRSVNPFPALLLSSFVAAAGCSGSIMEPGEGPTTPPDKTDPGGTGGKPGTTPPKGGTGGPGGLIDMPNNGTKTCATMSTLPATPRLVRLTRLQYENSIRDLTGLDVRPAKDLPLDTTAAGFNRGLDLEVGDILGRVFREQAEAVARQVVSSPANMAKVVPCEAKMADACMKTFIAEFGRRAFRRDLSAAEKTRYEGLFKEADTLVETGDAFSKGVQVTVEAMLQSANFLYRAETSTKKDGSNVALNSYDIASRLSFMLANTTPDAALLQAAAKDELTNVENVVTHAKRLLATPNGRATIRDFFGQWLRSDNWVEHLNKSPMLYPNWNADTMKTLLVEELNLFAEEVSFTQKKGLTALLTAPFTFVNKSTAPIYGVDGNFGDKLTKVDLDPTKRAGIVTMLGFLAGNADSSRSSPIHRGVEVQRQLLCTNIPPPGMQVPQVPPPSAGKTTREIVAQHTGGEGCKTCHEGFINPVGFGLENYDAVGGFRTMESGKPVDASGSLVGTTKNLPFKNGVEMAKAIAETPEARTCYAKQWLRYTLGREEKDADACAIDTLAESIGKDTYTASDLMVDLVRSRAFMYRSAEAR